MKRTGAWWAAMVAMVLVAAMGASESRGMKLADAAIRIEINDTDGDAGIHIFLDGEGWDRMRVFDPDGNTILDFMAAGSVQVQGITELFFESAEPSFDVQPLSELLELFPEGFYRFLGTTTEGEILRGKARLTHNLPEGPVLVQPVEDDDSVDPENTVIEWLPVPDPGSSRIVGYQVLVLREEGRLLVFSADVETDTTRITVPAEFMEPGTDYKFEVLAVEASGNQTISEQEFATAD